MIPDRILELAARAAAKDEDASNWDDEPEYYRNGWMNRIAPALDAVFAATVTSTDGLDEMPNGAVILAAYGGSAEKGNDVWFAPGLPRALSLNELLPATVIHEPEVAA